MAIKIKNVYMGDQALGKSWGPSMPAVAYNEAPSPIIATYGRSLAEEKLKFLWDEVSNPEYPELTEEEMEKLIPLLKSTDIEGFKLGIQMLSKHRFPRTLDNIIIIHDALTAYLRLIYE